jgi:hypothetical protein
MQKVMSNKLIYRMCLFLLPIMAGCFVQKKINKYKINYTQSDMQKDSILVKNFISIDSIVNIKKSDKTFYCPESILKLIVSKTGILNSGDMSFIGPKFTINDWVAWHKWFIKEFRD